MKKYGKVLMTGVVVLIAAGAMLFKYWDYLPYVASTRNPLNFHCF